MCSDLASAHRERLVVELPHHPARVPLIDDFIEGIVLGGYSRGVGETERGRQIFDLAGAVHDLSDVTNGADGLRNDLTPSNTKLSLATHSLVTD